MNLETVKLMTAQFIVGLFVIILLYAFYAALSISYTRILELPEFLRWHLVLMLTVGMLTGIIGTLLYEKIAEFAYL